MKSSRSATNPDRHLVVYVPQLESLLRETDYRPRLIAALLGRGQARSLAEGSPQADLAIGREVAPAALTRLVDRPDDAAGYWLRADPIGLVPDLAAVWLRPETIFPQGRWREELTALLDAEGLSLELTSEGRGYLRLDAAPQCRFVPPWRLAGASLDHCLPEGPEAGRWRRLLNDTQVVLHQLRRNSPEPDAVPGSLWFWGAGQLPEQGTVASRVSQIVADDPILTGLAAWLDLPRSFPGDGPGASAGALVEWPARFEASAEDNLERLATFLRPAWRRLRTGRIGCLELAGTDSVRRFSPRHAWQVWR